MEDLIMDRSFDLGKTMENLRKADDKDLKRVQEHIEEIMFHREATQKCIEIVEMLDRCGSALSDRVGLITEGLEEANVYNLRGIRNSLSAFIDHVEIAMHHLDND